MQTLKWVQLPLVPLWLHTFSKCHLGENLSCPILRLWACQGNHLCPSTVIPLLLDYFLNPQMVSNMVIPYWSDLGLFLRTNATFRKHKSAIIYHFQKLYIVIQRLLPSCPKSMSWKQVASKAILPYRDPQIQAFHCGCLVWTCWCAEIEEEFQKRSSSSTCSINIFHKGLNKYLSAWTPLGMKNAFTHSLLTSPLERSIVLDVWVERDLPVA